MQFEHAQYINLGTFRKTGVRVDTPVWFAECHEFFYVLSNNQAGKVKRIIHSDRRRIDTLHYVWKTNRRMAR